jgi:hypothetical protein
MNPIRLTKRLPQTLRKIMVKTTAITPSAEYDLGILVLF